MSEVYTHGHHESVLRSHKWRTADEVEKEAILAEGKDGFFTIQHFNGFNAYLIQLAEVTVQDLQEALVDGWLAMAPPGIAASFLSR